MATELLAVVEGEVMGRVVEAARGGTLSFQYESSWLDKPDAFPLSVSMPLAEVVYRQRIIRPFLANLLPENPAVLATWEREYRVSRANPFGMLRHVGEDCPGAVQFVRPENLEAYQAQAEPHIEWLTLEELAERMRRLRVNAAALRLPGDRGRMSLAGAQAKTALYFDGERWGVPSGRTPTSHILKPCIPGFDGIVEIEHLCQDIAARVGFFAARSFVLNLDEPVIVVERFDRLPDPTMRLRRIHQEDLCQVLALLPAQKYQETRGPGIEVIVRLLRSVSSTPVSDALQFVKANMLNFFIGGTDAHVKNYSLLIAPGEVRFAPLYDVSTQLPYPEQISQRLAMKVGRHYEVARICREDWCSLARGCRLDEEEVLAQLRELASALPDAICDAARAALEQGLNAAHITQAADLMTRNVDQLATRVLH